MLLAKRQSLRNCSGYLSTPAFKQLSTVQFVSMQGTVRVLRGSRSGVSYHVDINEKNKVAFVTPLIKPQVTRTFALFEVNPIRNGHFFDIYLLVKRFFNPVTSSNAEKD
ncbi:hypothetical protein OAM67_00020 [bacterium]|nr:hypothetical protein [bacterium]